MNFNGNTSGSLRLRFSNTSDNMTDADGQALSKLLEKKELELYYMAETFALMMGDRVRAKIDSDMFDHLEQKLRTLKCELVHLQADLNEHVEGRT